MNIDSWQFVSNSGGRHNVCGSLSNSLLMGHQVKLDLCIIEKNFRMNQSEVKLAKVFTPKLPWERKTDGVGLGEGQSHLAEDLWVPVCFVKRVLLRCLCNGYAHVLWLSGLHCTKGAICNKVKFSSM